MQNRPHNLAERRRGVDLAVCDCPQQRFDFLDVCQEPAGLLGLILPNGLFVLVASRCVRTSTGVLSRMM